MLSAISQRSIRAGNVPQRKTKIIKVEIGEYPQRKIHTLKNNRERNKLIEQVKRIVRGSF